MMPGTAPQSCPELDEGIPVSRIRRTLTALALGATALTTVTIASAEDVTARPADTAWGAHATTDDTAWGTPPTDTVDDVVTPLDTAWG